MKTYLNALRPNAFALLLGASLVLAFAPFNLFFLAVLAPAGLLGLLLDTSPRTAAWRGYCFGLGLFGAGIYWIFIAIHHYGDVPASLSVLITFALAAFLALYYAAVGYLTSRYFPRTTSTKVLFAFPAIWVGVEWIRSWLFTGFPWLFIGYSQTDSPLRGFAPLLSVYGTSLAVLISSGCVLNAYRAYRQKEFRTLFLSLFLLSLLWMAGSALTRMTWTQPHGETLSVSLVQGNIPQSLKWSPDHIGLSFDRYTDLTQSHWKKNELIVWPEAAIPMTVQDAAEFINMLDQKALATHATLITGIPMENPSGNGYYNAVVSLGEHKNTYLKRRLVPFGDYVPLQLISSYIFDFIHVPISGTIQGGAHQTPLQVGAVKLLTGICFEVAFPQVMYTTDKDIGALLVVTNDAWFDQSIAKAQHLQMAKMRAIELARPLLFASNDGITAVINESGMIETSAPPYIPYVLHATIQPRIGSTPWMSHGIDSLLVLLIILLSAAKITLSEKTNARTIQPAEH